MALAQDELAQRQARAAVTMVRMGKAEEVWPLLRHSEDPGCAFRYQLVQAS